jgi:hypothetical protein
MNSSLIGIGINFCPMPRQQTFQIHRAPGSGTVARVVHPVEVKDCDNIFDNYSDSPFFHAPYLRGLDVTEDETVFAAVTGCRCVVKISREGEIETVLKAEKPWTPTDVALRGKYLFVLEYTHHEKAENWVPRVRKLGPDGKTVILADLTHKDQKQER